MLQITNKSRLITVTRQDLSAGYQTAQTAHVLGEYAYKRPFQFWLWRKISGYLICLAVKDSEELTKLMKQLDKKGLKYVSFFEPDVGQITSIAITPSEEADRITKYIPRANKFSGTFDKNNK